MRLTWDGQYIHAAPWSVQQPGPHRRVARLHERLDRQREVDLRELAGRHAGQRAATRPRKVAPDDGWTDWNVTWDDFIKGSALPVTS